VANRSGAESLFQHGFPFVGHKQVVHFVGVFLFLDQGTLDHPSSAGVVITEISNQLAVMVDRDSFGDQIFLDHFDQIVRVPELRSGPQFQSLRVEIRCSAQLIDALRDRPCMFAFILRVFVEFFFDSVA
jgi:hypothetical protein